MMLPMIRAIAWFGPKRGPSSTGVSGFVSVLIVAAATTFAELEALDLDDLDAGLAHLGDRVGVALVGDDHAGLERDDVVAVVPLLALLLVLVAAGLDHLQAVDLQGVGDGAEEAVLDG